MISAATLATWAPSASASLRSTVEAGAVALIESVSGRDLSTPKAAAEPWILDVPDAPSGGLSQYMVGEMQWVALPEQPQRQLTGTWSITAGTTALAGSGGAALTELTTDAAVEIAGETIAVSSITDDDTVTLASVHVAGASAAAAYSDFLRVSIRSAPTGTWTALDPVDDVELDRETRLRLFSRSWGFPAGRRTVKVEAMLGYAEDAGPADVMLLLYDMIRAWASRPAIEVKSVSIPGALSVSWSSFGDQGAEFERRARRLGHPLLRAA